MTSALRNSLALSALAIALISAPAMRAQVLTFDVNIVTTGLSADAANAPFDLDFASTFGNTSNASNSVTLSNFAFTGGSALGSAVLTGGAAGSLTSTATLAISSTHPQSEIYQQFSSGVTDISFKAVVDEAGPNVGTPSEFTVAILDNSLGSPAQLFTTAPDTASLVTLNLDASNTLANINAYTSISSADGNTPVTGVTASISAIPEPSTTAAILGGAVMLFALGARRFARRQVL
jgi:hypothetical protein